MHAASVGEVNAANPLIKALLKTHPDLPVTVTTLTPTGSERVKREFGDRLAMWGTVGSSRLWDWGTGDQIRAEVRHRIDTLGPEGLLLAPAYDIDFSQAVLKELPHLNKHPAAHQMPVTVIDFLEIINIHKDE